MWTYQQSTGNLTDPDGNPAGTGYSGGNEGKNPEGVNNPALQGESCVGPIPQGLWNIGTFFDQVPGKGPIVCHLTPQECTDTLGLSGFMIHGDIAAANHSASEGCLILSHPIRQAIAASTDKVLHVIP